MLHMGSCNPYVITNKEAHIINGNIFIGRVTKNKTSTTSEQSQQGTNDRRHYQHIPRERLKASCSYLKWSTANWLQNQVSPELLQVQVARCYHPIEQSHVGYQMRMHKSDYTAQTRKTEANLAQNHKSSASSNGAQNNISLASRNKYLSLYVTQ